MKYLSICLLLLLAFVSGCQKKNDDLSNSSTTNGYVTPKSIPAFKITNMQGAYVVEGKNLKFQNTSQKAVSYHWDFGNGNSYDGEIPPADIYYVPCGGSYTITLTTKNFEGETAQFSKSFEVLCSGRNSHGTHLPD